MNFLRIAGAKGNVMEGNKIVFYCVIDRQRNREDKWTLQLTYWAPAEREGEL
jgi:hypothetical protein